jgi:hypothetical protein
MMPSLWGCWGRWDCGYAFTMLLLPLYLLLGCIRRREMPVGATSSENESCRLLYKDKVKTLSVHICIHLLQDVVQVEAAAGAARR